MWNPKFLINPCTGDCLVKATCHLLNYAPFTRIDYCPTYAKWFKRRDSIQNINSIIGGIIFVILGFSIVAFIAGTFGLGLWEEWKYVADFLREWFSG